MSKLNDLVEAEGFDDAMEMLEEFASDSVVPGICMNDGCDCTYYYEPDCSGGWCDDCQTNSVDSLMILADLM